MINKHFEVMKAWAEDIAVQAQDIDGNWVDWLSGNPPSFWSFSEWRIKPQESVEMNKEIQALKDWVKTQSLPVSSVEEHGFINGYRWALNDIKMLEQECAALREQLNEAKL